MDANGRESKLGFLTTDAHSCSLMTKRIFYQPNQCASARISGFKQIELSRIRVKSVVGKTRIHRRSFAVSFF
jgi:hypothetical protein